MEKYKYYSIDAEKQERRKVSKRYVVRLHNYEDDVVFDYYRESLSDAEFLAAEKAGCPQVSKIEILRAEKYETIVAEFK